MSTDWMRRARRLVRTRAPWAWPVVEKLERRQRLHAARRRCLRRDPAEALLFAGVERFCLFVGHPRSGHSALATLLNAHRNLLVSHNLDALDYLRSGFGRGDLFSLILEQDRRFAARGRRMSGDSYDVAGQWLGHYDALRVVGDKRAGLASRHLGEDPTLLRRLPALVGLPVWAIHQVRNPWDNIGSIWKNVDVRRGRGLATIVDDYFALLDAALRGLDEARDAVRIVPVRHEAFVRDPRATVGRVLEALGVAGDDAYFEACRRFVHRDPRRTRDAAPWTPALVARVAARARAYPVLEGYAFEE